ncbi:MAG: transporter substrate-binding domain-containing protein [Proteobacteria bacterium]|nr:transporter substrate-binding domain-containing protein [Pseudomonadota bacterium]
MYENFPPYSYKGDDGRVKGIDVDIGKAIANELGVQAGFRLFLADESVGDDLRNMVWKGHYLAGAPADVMMHVPYDAGFANENDKVAFLQPYYKELIAFAINTYRVRSAMNLEVFTKETIGVETASLADAYLLGAYNGGLRENVKHYSSILDAAKAMVDKDISAIMGNRGELEYTLGQYDHDFVITKLPTPGLTIDGWELGPAVNASNVKLAERLNEIVGELKTSGKIEAIFSSYGISYKTTDSSQMIIKANQLSATK